MDYNVRLCVFLLNLATHTQTNFDHFLFSQEHRDQITHSHLYLRRFELRTIKIINVEYA